MLDRLYQFVSPQTLAWCVVLFPLLGAATNGLYAIVASRLRRETSRSFTSWVGCGLPLLSFAAVVILFFTLTGFREDAPAMATGPLFQWIVLEGLSVDVALHFDALSLVMALIVTGVGSLIHVYSMGYMGHDEGYTRYFATLNLFLAFMLLLVLGDNLVLLFVGWEGVGLCSYLLIGFWYEDREKARCGKKAFIVNRIGDAGFLLGMFFIYATLAHPSLPIGEGGADNYFSFEFIRQHQSLLLPVATPICLLLFFGACGKSAQLPLYVWLPDAMAGPTPVSALIHAATMVTAGVYMIARLHFLYVLSPLAMEVVAWVGCLTAVFAATIGLVQNDIKKVLAYSTISQLGYMFMAMGVGAFSAGIFHLMTHAFFKALLFLGAGSVIHAMGGEQDIRKFGALKDKMPVTCWTFVIASAAIAGLFPLAGFFSKDAILWQAFHGGRTLLWFMGFLGAGLTAFYMFRLVGFTFFGEPEMGSGRWIKAHESPPSMSSVLMILGVLSVIGGWIGIPEAIGGADRFHHFLEGVFGVSAAHEAAKSSHGAEIVLMVVSFLWALHFAILASVIYAQRRDWPDRMAGRFKRLYRLLWNKYWIDELYDFVFTRPIRRISETVLWRFFDATLIDHYGVHGSGRVVLAWNRVVTAVQNGVVQQYLFLFVVGAVLVLWGWVFRT